MPCLCHTEDTLLKLLVPFSSTQKDHLTFFFPCMEEQESKIATGNRKQKITISEDEKKKNLLFSSLIAVTGSLNCLSLKSSF